MIDLLIILVLSVVLVPLAGFSSGALRIVLGLVFVLFSPGYTLIAALFPRKTSLGSIERITLSLGLSVCMVALIGLVLNYTPWGIRLWPILISVLVFIIITLIIALFRRRGLPNNEQFHLRLKFWLDTLRKQGRWDRILNLLLVVVILGTIGILGYVVANPKVGERFTEFTVLGTEGRMENYPSEIALGESVPVKLNIKNREHAQVIYRIEIRIDGQLTDSIVEIVLENDEEWEEEVYLTPINSGENQIADFLLFRAGESEAYRSLHIWLDVN